MVHLCKGTATKGKCQVIMIISTLTIMPLLCVCHESVSCSVTCYDHQLIIPCVLLHPVTRSVPIHQTMNTVLHGHNTLLCLRIHTRQCYTRCHLLGQSNASVACKEAPLNCLAGPKCTSGMCRHKQCLAAVKSTCSAALSIARAARLIHMQLADQTCAPRPAERAVHPHTSACLHRMSQTTMPSPQAPHQHTHTEQA
jgi:hypothetical protein